MLRLVFLVESPEISPTPGVEVIEARLFAPSAIPRNLHPGQAALIPKIIELARGSQVYFDPATSVEKTMSEHQRPSRGR
jgi:hypothetical protein